MRETTEETGFRVHLGMPLPAASYTILDRDGVPATKQVRYWAAEVVGGKGRLVNEIDEVAWLDVLTAHDKLDYARDRDQLRASCAPTPLAASRPGRWSSSGTARRRARGSWKRPDPQRPLDDKGLAQAKAIGPILAAYGVTRLVSSTSVRCTDTLRPYAVTTGIALRLKEGLSEEGYAAGPGPQCPSPAPGGCPWCAGRPVQPRPVLPSLLTMLRQQVDESADDGPDAAATLDGAAAEGMDKGEVLVCHVVGSGDAARITAVERYPT
jgi:8-oxo-dGTP diphosphatase